MKGNFYKEKYLNLRAKFLSSIDMAWRDGYEAGTIEAQQEAMQVQQQQEQEMMAQAQGGMGEDAQNAAFHAPGQPGVMEGGEQEPSQEEQEMAANSADAFGGQIPPMQGELGKNIDQLLEMLSKGSKPKIKDLRNVVEKIDSLRKNSEEIFIPENKNKVSDIIAKMEQKDAVKKILKKEKDA